MDGKWGGGAVKGHGVSFLGDDNVLKLIMVIVVQSCEYTKNHWIVYFKVVHYMWIISPKAVLKKMDSISLLITFQGP